MKFRKMGNTGFDVSVLGFGYMRLPTTDGMPLGQNIDENAAIRMARHAIDKGVNYIDTAYFYHGGRSESVLGKALKRGYRSKVKIATKSPLWSLKNDGDFDRILDEQLKRLGVEHIDFYLLHGLSGEWWERAVERFDLLSKAERAKKSGKIGHIGFSFHDDKDAFKRIVDAYDNWEFCQIQLNYMNEDYQAGIEGLRYAAGKGLGVVIMEPLYGGRLAAPSEAAAGLLAGGDRSPCQWALDYLWDMPEVSTVLSGMSSMEQLDQNIDWADRAAPGMLTQEDKAVIAAARRALEKEGGVPCTGCGYCMPCPQCVDIPRNFSIYNDLHRYGTPHLAKSDYEEMRSERNGRLTADNCARCGQCEEKCPQHIQIQEVLGQIDKTMR